MTFTYSGTAVSTDLAKVRMEIGDTVEAQALFTDEEIQVKLTENTSVLVTAASLCDILSRRYAREYDFGEDGQSFSRSQMSKQYAALSTELRERATGITSNPTTRVDGYSDDVDYAETAATSGIGRVRAGWFDPDLPL